MRYEDWQKYIDSQFLDEASEPVVPVTHSVAIDVEPAFHPAPAIIPEPVPYPIANYSIPVYIAPVNQRIDETLPVPPTPEPEPVDLPRRMSEPRPEHNTSGIVDIEIPSIDSYLPFLRKNVSPVQPVEQVVETPIEIPPVAIEVTPQIAEIEAIVNPEIAVAEISTNVLEEPTPILATTVTSKPLEPIAEIAVVEKEVPHARLNSIIYKRTRTPKSNRKLELTELLSLSDLWLLTPRTFDGLRPTNYSEEQRQRIELVNAICDYRTELSSNGPDLTPRIVMVHGKSSRSPLSPMRQPGETRAYRLTEAIAFIESESAKGSVQA